MSHQPYESWIFDEVPLSPEERVALQDHLENCTACRDLHQSWSDARSQMKNLPMRAPSKGFSQRWSLSLNTRREFKTRNQTWWFFLVIAGGASISLLLMASQILILGSPFDLLLTILHKSIHFAAHTSNIFKVLITGIQIIPTAIIIPAGILFLLVFLALCFMWFFSLSYISKKKRGKDEPIQ